jgi:hypothetical protein
MEEKRSESGQEVLFGLCILFTSTIGKSEDGRTTEEGGLLSRY